MFPNITLWHSALRQACESAPGGRLRVTLRSHALESTYDDRPLYVEIEVDGDKRARKYQLESDEIQALLESVPTGTPIWIQAGGSRGSPTMQAWTDEGARIPQPGAEAEAEAPRPRTPPPARSDKTKTPAPAGNGARPAESHPPADNSARPAESRGRATIAADMWTCLLEARRLCDRYDKEFGRAPTDDELRVAAALYIQYNMEGGRRALSRKPPTPADLRADSD